MTTIYVAKVQLSDGSALERQLKAPSAEVALARLQSKFPPSARIEIVGSREQTAEERDEEERIRAGGAEMAAPGRVAIRRRKRTLLGGMLLAVGVCGPLAERLIVGRAHWLLDALFLVFAAFGLLFILSSQSRRPPRDEAPPARRYRR